MANPEHIKILNKGVDEWKSGGWVGSCSHYKECVRGVPGASLGAAGSRIIS